MEEYQISLKDYLKELIGWYSLEEVHTCLEEICKEEFDFLKRLYSAKVQKTSQVHSPFLLESSFVGAGGMNSIKGIGNHWSSGYQIRSHLDEPRWKARRITLGSGRGLVTKFAPTWTCQGGKQDG
jgi:hypothetical protein